MEDQIVMLPQRTLDDLCDLASQAHDILGADGMASDRFLDALRGAVSEARVHHASAKMTGAY